MELPIKFSRFSQQEFRLSNYIKSGKSITIKNSPRLLVSASLAQSYRKYLSEPVIPIQKMFATHKLSFRRDLWHKYPA
jgi:hypothetical protein